MPRYDRTGPNGDGSMTGRKTGLCTGNRIDETGMPYGNGRGRGRFGFGNKGNGNNYRRGRGNFGFINESNPNEEKILHDEIAEMRKQLSALQDQLNKMKK